MFRLFQQQRSIVIALFGVLFSLTTTLCANNNKMSSLALSVQASLLSEHVVLNDKLTVSIIITNISNFPIKFKIFTCGWPVHWKANTNLLTILAKPCSKNTKKTISLASNESYMGSVNLQLLAKDHLESLAFKLGFTPLNSEIMYWSNPLLIKSINQ